MSLREISPGLRAALGAVRLTLANQPPTFRRDGRSVLSLEIEPPGALIGRHKRADVVLEGGRAQYVSNFHLLIQPSGGIWVARDNGSTHGTTAHEPSRGRVVLRPQQPLPLVDGMSLELAGVVRLNVTLVPPADVLPTAPPDGGRSVRIPAWIPDPDQQELADLLTEPRRRGRAARITAEDVGAQLHWSASKAHRVRRALASHPEVARHLDGDGQVSFVRLGDAVALAFPYLIEPRPEAG